MPHDFIKFFRICYNSAANAYLIYSTEIVKLLGMCDEEIFSGWLGSKVIKVFTIYFGHTIHVVCFYSDISLNFVQEKIFHILSQNVIKPSPT